MSSLSTASGYGVLSEFRAMPRRQPERKISLSPSFVKHVLGVVLLAKRLLHDFSQTLPVDLQLKYKNRGL